MLSFPSNPRTGQSYAAPNGQIYVWDGVKWIGTSVSGGGTTTITNNIENPFSFNVAADDSTQRSISNGELIKFIGAGTVTTSSDAEGYITITGASSGSSTGDITFSTNNISAPAGADVNVRTANNGSGNGGDVNLIAGTGSINNGIVRITTAGTYEWQFDNGGDLTAPGDIFGSFTGPLTGDVRGSVFGDDSSVIVNGIDNSIHAGNIYINSNGYIRGSADQTLNIQTSYNTSVPGQTISAIDAQNGPTNNWITIIISGGGTNYPEIVAVQPGWTVTGTGLTNEPVTQVEQVDLGGGTVVYKIYTAISSTKAGYTYNFTAPSTTVNTTKTWAFSDRGDLTIPGDIKSNSNINIDINLADSTLRRWQFGEDGIFNTPGSINVNGSIFLPGNIGIEEDSGSLLTAAPNDIIISSGTDGTGSVFIKTNQETKEWTFNDAGTLELPGGGLITTSSGVSVQPPTGGTLMLGDPMNALIIDTANGILSVFGGNRHTGSEIRNYDVDNWLDLNLAGGNVGLKSVAGSVTVISEGSGQTLNWIFHKDNYLQFPDLTVQTTAYTGYHTGDMTGSVFADDSTMVIDGADGSVYASKLRTTETKIALGLDAGAAGTNAIAIGEMAGQTTQGNRALSIGYQAGFVNQGVRGIAIGQAAANGNQGANGIAIGETAGAGNQGIDAIAIGQNAGLTSQGTNAIAIGRSAGANNQSANSIVLNASGSTLDAAAAGFFVNPIRNTNGGKFLTYNTSTKEIGYFDSIADIARNIESENDVSITVNLTDSTKRIWQFGEDGKLTFPDGANYAGQTVTMPTTPNGVTNSFVWEFSDQMIGSETITLNWNLLAADTDSFYLGTTHSTAGKYLILEGNSQSLSYISNGTSTNSKIIFGAPAGNDAGDVNAIELKSINGDVYLTSTESVKITVDANDSSARVWTFDPTGNLTVPGSIANLEGTVNFQLYNDSFRFNTYNQLGAATYIEGQPENLFLMGNQSTLIGANGNSWDFTAEGNLHIPGDIRSNKDIVIEVNLFDSTLRRWQFGEDGIFNTPGDIIVGGNVSRIDGGDLTVSAGANVYVNSTSGSVYLGTNADTTSVILGSKTHSNDVAVLGDLQIITGVYETFSSIADATGVVTHNCANGHIFYHTSPDANWTVNVTNLNATQNRATTITCIISQGGTGYYPNALQIAGAAQTINWQGNTTPTPSTNRTDVVTFSILNTGSGYVVLGQLTGF